MESWSFSHKYLIKSMFRKKKADDISPASYSLEDYGSANLTTQR